MRQFPELDVLFVGVGTTGTLRGCARYLRQRHRPVRIVAVGAVGSVTFGGSTGTVIHGAMRWLAEHGTVGNTAVAIAPDLGGRYLDTVYDPPGSKST